MTNSFCFNCQVLDQNVGDVARMVHEALLAEGFTMIHEFELPLELADAAKSDGNESACADARGMRPRVFVAACHPELLGRVCDLDHDATLIQPSMLSIYETAEGETMVSIIDPVETVKLALNTTLQPLAFEAATRLKRILRALAPEG